MALLIDTSVFISLERRGELPNAIHRFTPDDRPAIAAITAAELLFGVERAEAPLRRARRAEFVDSVFDLVTIVPFELAIARVLAVVWAQLNNAGTPIGPYDLLVVSTAIARRDAVLTENAAEFRRVPGLEVVTPNWST